MTLAEIYEKHVDFVWRCLRRQGVPPADAADAIQEVFLAVHRTLASFEGRASLPTWLFTICRSVARDRRERAHRRHEVPSAERLGEVDERADASARLEHNARLSLLETILSAMEPDLRDVFVLYEIEDMTGEEIGQALSVPLGTVYSRLQVARAAFKRQVVRIEAAEARAEERMEARTVTRAGGRA
jgi:RNA polymerase sigma-70 factor, ECF subfamily